jgi:hypothetical protein
VPRIRCGTLLKSLGRDAEAQGLFSFIAANARRSAVESEKEWLKLAARERVASAA